MADVLVAEGLSRWFRAGEEVVVAVRDATLRVGEGELVAILGRSGAGKSSLLFLCGGLDRPTSGRVTVAGQEVGALDDAALERFLQRMVGWVFQSPGLLPLFTAEENVALALRLLGRPPDAARAALAAVELGNRAGHRGAELSGGEQQRVALARALVKEPALLIADEPTGQLDTETGRAVLDVLRRTADAGTAVLLATHDPAAVEVADRVLLMEDGVLRSAPR
ncbi:MAG TPA: ABC transporter ATP-binding protein [Candidatus Dormibacteraeota bacterium]|jgi:putative ABC transport system ATP-binding protein